MISLIQCFRSRVSVETGVHQSDWQQHSLKKRQCLKATDEVWRQSQYRKQAVYQKHESVQVKICRITSCSRYAFKETKCSVSAHIQRDPRKRKVNTKCIVSHLTRSQSSIIQCKPQVYINILFFLLFSPSSFQFANLFGLNKLQSFTLPAICAVHCYTV